MRPILAALSVIVVVLGPAAANAAKTDVVGLVNGDEVTGEIKSLDFGSLSYKTDSMGTVTIDWDDVVGLTSNQNLQVELVNGTKYFGQLLAAEASGMIRVRTASTEVSFPVSQIVRMTPIDPDENFIEKLDGSKQAKARARAIVKSLTGEATIEEAAAEANVAPSRFHLLRERALEEMVQGLEPRTPGRKPAEPDLEAIVREKEALASRVKEREIELAKSRVREATAQWGGSGGKRWSPRRRK